MPEIAEVRIISDNISHLINGKKLTCIEVLTAEYKGIKGLSELNAKLPLMVTNVRTKGKFSWLELNDETAVGYGLGMSGNVRIEPTPEHLADYNHRCGIQETAAQYLRHAHLRIHYEDIDGTKHHFYYHDIRRFGRWEYLSKLQLISKLNKLGSDLIQETLSDAEVIRLFRRHNHTNICKILMNQNTIAGVGAYIKSEILYECKIHPLAIIRDLPDKELIALYKAAKDIALRAYTAGGTSLYTFTGMNGDKSDFKNTFSVYGRIEDLFGNKVVRIPDSESPDRRTTHWVPTVQIIGAPPPTPSRKKIVCMLKTPDKRHLVSAVQIPAKMRIKAKLKSKNDIPDDIQPVSTNIIDVNQVGAITQQTEQQTEQHEESAQFEQFEQLVQLAELTVIEGEPGLSVDSTVPEYYGSVAVPSIILRVK